MHNLLIYGGTFDPVHKGHIHTALAVQNAFHFENVLFLPCKTPVLKTSPATSTQHRVNMLKLAISSHPDFQMDLREIKRNTPSFMVDTLKSFRDELGENLAISLLLGMDTFIQLPQWYQWQQIIKLANLLVIQRPGIHEQNIPETVTQLLSNHETTQKKELLHSPCGKIYRFNAGHYDISSSWIRQQIKKGNDVGDFLPEAVYQYIFKNLLYH